MAENQRINRDGLFALLRAERAYNDTSPASYPTGLPDGILAAQHRLNLAAEAWVEGADDVTPITRLFRAAGLILQTLELYGRPLLDRMFKDMDFAREAAGCVTPHEQAKFLWPALDAIRARAAAEPDEAHIAAQWPDHDVGGEG